MIVEQRFDRRMQEMSDHLDQAASDPALRAHYRGRTILVTGGAGAIGSNLCLALSQWVGPDGRVVVLDDLSAIREARPWNVPALDNVLFVRGDVRSDVDLKRVFREEPSLVFHLAAFFANQNSVDYPETSADVDVIGTIRLLEYARLARVERFVYASSGCAIYGSYPELPLSEDFVSMHLTTPYQIHKMTGEMYANYYAHQYGLGVVNCRFFNSYGPGEIPGQYRNVIPNFLYWALQGRSLPVTGTGEETRDFTSVFDLTNGLLRAGYFERALGQNFNLASGTETAIGDLAERVNRATGNSAPVEYRPRRRWDTKPRLLASIDKARALIGYEPRVDFERGFESSLRWFRDHWAALEQLADFPPGMSSAVRRTER